MEQKITKRVSSYTQHKDGFDFFGVNFPVALEDVKEFGEKMTYQ